MKIELKEITVRELTKGYEDNDESGVFAYDGKLDMRFPRNFVCQRVDVMLPVFPAVAH